MALWNLAGPPSGLAAIRGQLGAFICGLPREGSAAPVLVVWQMGMRSDQAIDYRLKDAVRDAGL